MIPRRRVSAILAIALVAGGALVTIAFFFLQGSRQRRSGSVEVPGLTAAVDVTYDEWAIPTLFAATEEDVLRAQGFVHASERLWQMDLFQRIARGRLSEIFGEAALPADRLARTLDLWGAAGRELESLSELDRTRIEAYTAGVNARLATWRGTWPLEFVILGIEPQPWTAQASLVIGRLMALDLTGMRTEISRAMALAELPEDRRPALDPAYPDWGPTIVQDSIGPLRLDLPSPETWRSGGAADAISRVPVPPPPEGGWDPVATLSSFALHASNGWALGGSRTADGHPLVANDMHLGLRAPSTWFINVLRVGEDGLAVAGLSIPGAPGVIVGMNRDLAWAFTNAMNDDADLIAETVDASGGRYLDGGDWRPFERRLETFGVRDRDTAVTFEVRTTVRGPVVSDVLPAGDATLSLLWTGLEAGGAASAIFDMNRARTAPELEAAIAGFRSPHQNVIYATTGGSLGYRMSGSVPERGDLTVATPIAHDALPDGWAGLWPPARMPALRQPASDFLASANNLQSRAAWGRVGVDYPMPFRARRITDVLSAARTWQVADMRELQLDTYSLLAARYRGRALAAARRVGADEVADELAGWDLRAAIDAPGATRFFAWFYRLRQAIAADEYGEGGGYFPDVALFRVLEGEDTAWVDDVRTPGRETLESLEDAAMRAVAELPSRPWGDVHLERSTHPLGNVRLLQVLFRFDVGPYAAPGERHTVRPDDYGRRNLLDDRSWAVPMMNQSGPSERFVAHLAPDDPRAHFLLPTGQSGNPLDRHYRDMAERWTRGELVEVPLLGDRPDAASRLRLWPPAGLASANEPTGGS